MVSHEKPPGYAGPLEGKDPWPLKFYRHAFGARHFNTLKCEIIYDRFLFTSLTGDKPQGAMPANFLVDWTASYNVSPSNHGGKTFPGPVRIKWVSLDGMEHAASVGLDAIFKDRLLLHRVAREDVRERWLEGYNRKPDSPDILLAVNDRTICVYIRGFVVTEREQIPGNPRSHFRDDLMLAWSHTY